MFSLVCVNTFTPSGFYFHSFFTQSFSSFLKKACHWVAFRNIWHLFTHFGQWWDFCAPLYVYNSSPLCLCLSSYRQHLSNDDCLENKREDYQNCSVLCCVPGTTVLRNAVHTATHTDEQFLWLSVYGGTME